MAIVDSLSQVGGQVTAMYPEKDIYDIAGLPVVTGHDLISGLVEQAGRYDPSFILGEEAQDLTRTIRADGREQLLVRTGSGTAITAGAVIVTGGIGTFTPRPLPAGEEFLGRGLEYFVPSKEPYAGKDVVIVGGGDSALDWCLMLEPIASSVTLIHRRDEFRAHPGSVEQVHAADVNIITNAQVTALQGCENVERALVQVKGEETPRDVACQQVVAALGFTANLGPLRRWGLELQSNRHLVVDTKMRTDLPGVFAAGDIADYPGKVRLIAVGFGEVATAVNNAAVYIDPDAQLFPGHSTDTPPPARVPA